MKYLIKDLSQLTGLSSARIRKWQQRYQLLEPVTAENGYHYYSNEDLLVLNYIKQEIESGGKISHVAQMGRRAIVKTELKDKFAKTELRFIKNIALSRFQSIAREFDKHYKDLAFQTWVDQILSQHIKLVGRAWQQGYLSIADEHSFSHWFMGYFRAKLNSMESDIEPEILVVVYPSDHHELGALLYYGLLLDEGKSARYCGNLPLKEIKRELRDRKYKQLAVSLVLPRRPLELERFEKSILKSFPKLKVCFGGEGYQPYPDTDKQIQKKEKKK